MASMASFAGYVRSKSKAAPDADPDLEKQPPNQDVNTFDVISNQNRLLGVRGLKNLKSRSA